ncbi:MAG: flagellar biosynthesis protein FlhF [Nitrospinae bacterium]|nr:flagellar biosynthesis protein FlhF [Nitrospinota bacterium]
MGNMQVKRYEAMDMGEALRMIKGDLGPEAVILTTRQLKKGNGAFGIFARPVIEVTAALPAAPKVKGRLSRSSIEMERPVGAMVDTRTILEGTAAVMEPLWDGLDDIRKYLAAIATKEESQNGGAGKIEDEVRELKSMIYHLLDQAAADKERHLGRSYLALSRILKDKGVATEYAQNLINEIKDNSRDGEPDLKTLIHVVATRMRDTLTFGGAITPPSQGEGKPRVVAFAGPTGVGKTTTIAKIAAKLSLEGAKVGLVTIDTFRVAAVEQLKIYAKILNIPLDVVLTPNDLGRSLHMYKGMDIVLIDTAGRSQRDLEQIDELRKFLEQNPAIESRLVLSAAASEKQMEETWKNFSSISLAGLVFTKLDEAASLGAVFNQQLKTGLPISYFTTGQRVPEDIEEATAKRLINGLFKP